MRHKKSTDTYDIGRVKVISPTVATRTQDDKGNYMNPTCQSTSFSECAATINRDIAQRQTKSAVEKAKQIHKQIGTAESEALLVGAYFARIQNMMEIGLRLEAQELMALVERRYP